MSLFYIVPLIEALPFNFNRTYNASLTITTRPNQRRAEDDETTSTQQQIMHRTHSGVLNKIHISLSIPPTTNINTILTFAEQFVRCILYLRRNSILLHYNNGMNNISNDCTHRQYSANPSNILCGNNS